MLCTPVVYWLERCPFKAEKRDRNPFGVPFVKHTKRHSSRKTEKRGGYRVCLTNVWADSDNGSTGALQAFSRGSIPRRSTKVFIPW